MSDPVKEDKEAPVESKEIAVSSTTAAAEDVPASSPESLYDKLQELMSEDPRIGWPAHKELKAKLHGWFRTGNMTMLQRLLPPKARCIVELGSWLGRSTKFLCERCPEAMVFAVDLWSNEYFTTDNHYDKEEPDFANILRSNAIYDQFLSNLAEYRLRPPTDGAAAVGLVPMKMDSCLALRALHKLGVKPELIYIDASHHYEFVVKDVTTCLELFPEAILVGDDWDNEDVRRAVQDVALRENQPIYVEGGTCWTFSKSLVLDIVAKERREKEKQAEQNEIVNKIRAKRGFDAEQLKQLFKRKKT